CPRCIEGRMFRGMFAMNDPCPKCGLLFQREEGYFLGAMYFSYVLGAAVILPLYFLLAALLPGWDGVRVAALAWLAYLPFLPVIFRYSRVLWVYLERSGRFNGSDATVYEKLRLSEIERQKAASGPRQGAEESAVTPGSPTAPPSRGP